MQVKKRWSEQRSALTERDKRGIIAQVRGGLCCMAMLGLDLFTIISGIAVITMLFAVVKAYDYKRSIPDGEVGKAWNVLSSLAGFFLIGYLTTPFFIVLPQEVKDLIVAFIFLFGAVYVLITLWLVHKIITAMKR
jgi:hypothetical protein